MCAHAVQVAADTQVDELITQLSHLTQPEATGSDGQNEEGSQTENLIAQVSSRIPIGFSSEYADWCRTAWHAVSPWNFPQHCVLA